MHSSGRIPQVGIVDLGFSNSGSVLNMLRKCEADPVIVTSPDQLSGLSRVILAGVGAFDSGMLQLTSRGWIEALEGIRKSSEVKILGICLGMQLMTQSSEEGVLPGLGWFDADVQRLRPDPESGSRVPHMGWNYLNVLRTNPYLSANSEPDRFFFVHSYHVVCHESSLCMATVQHGQTVTAAIGRGNLFGVQFHPEKSHKFGMNFLKRFVAD